jgi:hypothetical protein
MASRRRSGSRWATDVLERGPKGRRRLWKSQSNPALLFVPYGLGLTALTTTAQFLLCLAFFFLFQVPVSHWWLARYRYGPTEWLWRSATYGAVQPMRGRPVPVVAGRDAAVAR